MTRGPPNRGTHEVRNTVKFAVHPSPSLDTGTSTRLHHFGTFIVGIGRLGMKDVHDLAVRK